MQMNMHLGIATAMIFSLCFVLLWEKLLSNSMTDDTIKNMKNLQAKKSLTPKRKAELNKAVKKTVKQYRTTLELLAKT